MKSRSTGWAVACAMSLAFPATASITFTGNGGVGTHHQATVTFDVLTGNKLQITLSNIDSTSGKFENVWGLTGLFWDFTSTQALTPLSATLPVGSTILDASQCSTGNCVGATNVGGEFSYVTSADYTSGAPSGIGANGIGSSGYLTGNALSGNLGGPNLDNPNELDGPNFSILGANATGLKAGGNGNNLPPSVKDSVVFVLDGLTSAFKLTDITNVLFTYGTQWGEGQQGGTCTTGCSTNGGGGGGGGGGSTPEPATLALVGFGLLGAGMARRRRRA